MEKTNYIKLNACPICGEHPELKKESLAGPRNIGYPGHFTYQYRCNFCTLLRGEEHHDIYDKNPEDAKNRAKESWNKEVDRIRAFQQANRERQIVNKL